MVGRTKIIIFSGAGLASFALLLLIISVATPGWLDDGKGNTVGLFRQCYADNVAVSIPQAAPGCVSANQVTQGGLSVFGLLLLAFGIITLIAGHFLKRPLILFISLGLLYFASMFIMAAYATWGTYSREPALYTFPYNGTSTIYTNYTSMGYSYHLCVAVHYFLWSALALISYGIGSMANEDSNSNNPH